MKTTLNIDDKAMADLKREAGRQGRGDDTVFEHACKLGCEGTVSNRMGSRYRSGRSPHRLNIKNFGPGAAKREAPTAIAAPTIA